MRVLIFKKEKCMEDIVRKETMTSLEVAEVTGKRHDSVLRDIRNLLSQGVDAHNFVETSYIDKSNRQQKCFTLTKKGCLILASGYDALLREKIIDRWEELETKARKNELTMPNFSNPAEAARAWADQYEKNLALEVKNEKLEAENQVLTPKGEYFDDLVERNLLTNFTDVAKQLNIKRKTFIELLIRDKFVYRDQKKRIKPYKQYSNTYFHVNDAKSKHNLWVGNQTLITAKGKEAFRLLYERKGENLLTFKE